MGKFTGIIISGKKLLVGNYTAVLEGARMLVQNAIRRKGSTLTSPERVLELYDVNVTLIPNRDNRDTLYIEGAVLLEDRKEGDSYFVKVHSCGDFRFPNSFVLSSDLIEKGDVGHLILKASALVEQTHLPYVLKQQLEQRREDPLMRQSSHYGHRYQEIWKDTPLECADVSLSLEEQGKLEEARGFSGLLWHFKKQKLASFGDEFSLELDSVVSKLATPLLISKVREYPESVLLGFREEGKHLVGQMCFLDLSLKKKSEEVSSNIPVLLVAFRVDVQGLKEKMEELLKSGHHLAGIIALVENAEELGEILNLGIPYQAIVTQKILT